MDKRIYLYYLHYFNPIDFNITPELIASVMSLVILILVATQATMS